MEKFKNLVKEMRQAQKDYFRCPSSQYEKKKEILQRSKLLERKVDHAIEEMENPKLF